MPLKKIQILILTLSLLVLTACKQANNNNITGNWLLTEGHEELATECPDYLRFSNDGTYTVFNDCYGEDIHIPVTEKGTWSFQPTDKMIHLKNRSFTSNYYFHDSSSILKINVKSISNKKLVICIDDDSPCKKEVYFRKILN